LMSPSYLGRERSFGRRGALGGRDHCAKADRQIQFEVSGSIRLRPPAERLTILRSIGGRMARTRVSPKFQVVIPKEVRESMDLQVGQELQVISKGGVITLVPERPLSSLRGFARGIRTDKLRE